MQTLPESLVTEMAEHRCVIVVGSGVSANSTPTSGDAKLPTWKDFLSQSANLLQNNDDKHTALELIRSRAYLDAAQVIQDALPSSDFSHFIHKIFVQPVYTASRIHQIIHELDAKIIITTNYDDIYERYCLSVSDGQGYKVAKYYETHAINDIRSRFRVILKAHGCIVDPSKIILSRSSYFKAKRQYQTFYSILDAIFLTHTLLFVGCGLNDPDIQLVLENANLSAPSDHPHYSIQPAGLHSSIKRAIKTAYNIEIIEYPNENNDHVELENTLTSFKNKVLEYRADQV